jgi:GalNAc-alpha-(1->4)-GalNAc-alpha-(1->3)-diNAcBac-PP-undecaprenol alpha-1,4-N-acetyl-D-galactosaminyltransferase
MRVTIVIAGLGGGGAERVCVNLANAWVAPRVILSEAKDLPVGHGEGPSPSTRLRMTPAHEVTLFTISMRSLGSVYPLDPRVIRRDLGWPPAAEAAAAPQDDAEVIMAGLRDAGCPELAGEVELMCVLRAGILETQPDVVVSHMDLTNVRVLAALHGTNIPVVACEHTDPARVSLGAWDRARGALYSRARAVVASHDATTSWLTRRGVAACTIPNALVPPSVEPRRNGRKRLVTLGRLAPEKRVDMLIRAFERIAHDLPEWDLDIYGEGPLRENLTRVANNVPGRVTIRGFTHDPYAALASADLYASASCVEGFGNAIWEALACGIPVVALDCGPPVRTLVRDGVDGRIVYGGEHALAITLAELMRDDAARERLAERACEAKKRYALDSVLRKWDEVLA